MGSHRRAIFILGGRRRGASFILSDSSSNYILGDRRRASFILSGHERRTNLSSSSRIYILGDRRRASFILGKSSRNYISSINHCIISAQKMPILQKKSKKI